MYFGGIDPGKSGGIVVLSKDGDVLVKEKMGTEKDTWELLSYVSTFFPGIFFYLEEITALPKEMRGSISSFKFGMNYGGIRMALIGNRIPFDVIRPQRWQAIMKCKGEKIVKKSRAQELFPNIKVTNWLADALLIAECNRRCRCYLSERELNKEV